MGGWLDLTQQGLSPCKKYKTSWRSSTVKVFGQPYLDFADFVEQGLINPRKIQEVAYGYLKPIKEN
ncbi:hypothetical protein ES707_08909 [subsurface metagenome]